MGKIGDIRADGHKIGEVHSGGGITEGPLGCLVFVGVVIAMAWVFFSNPQIWVGSFFADWLPPLIGWGTLGVVGLYGKRHRWSPIGGLMVGVPLGIFAWYAWLHVPLYLSALGRYFGSH